MAAPARASIPLDRNPTFRDAAASYVQHHGPKRYLQRVVDYFGDTPVADIAPFDVKQMARTLYDKHGNATLNRQALTPARAVLIHAYERGWCGLMRLTRFKQDEPKRKNPASTAWLQLFVRQCDLDGLQHLAAMVMFMSQTGARVSEAVRLQWAQVDLVGREAVLLRTKTSVNSRRSLSDPLIRLLRALDDRPDPTAAVFRYSSRYSVNDRIKAVCEGAGISYKSTHACGRHSFATNSLAQGNDVKTTMEAGGWKSSVIFLEIYVHVRNPSRRVADSFNSVEFDQDI